MFNSCFKKSIFDYSLIINKDDISILPKKRICEFDFAIF